MNQLRPQVRENPGNPADGPLMNATAMIEVARRADTPRSRAFLAAYHASEADLARRDPSLSEEAIRSGAMKAIGATVTVDGRPA
jgi:hypothetical protein